MQPKAAGQSFKSANDLTLEKGNRLTLEKGNQLTLEKGNQLTLEKGSQLTLEKGNQLTLDKGNKLTLETGPQSLPAPANLWERDRANSSSSQDLMPGPRTVATLGPPEGYWESFHQQWLQRVGGCKFAIGRQSLQFVRNEDNWLYCCLLLEPEASLFPVIKPHMSLCRCKFDTFQSFWTAKIWCQSILWSRHVRGDFTGYGKGTNFKVREGCELAALGSMLRSQLTQHCSEVAWLERDLHISWNLL